MTRSASKKQRQIMAKRWNTRTASDDSDCEIVENITDYIDLDAENAPILNHGTASPSKPDSYEAAATPEESAPMFFEDRNPGTIAQRVPVYTVKLMPLIAQPEPSTSTVTVMSEPNVANGTESLSLPIIQRTITNDLYSKPNGSVSSPRNGNDIDMERSTGSITNIVETVGVCPAPRMDCAAGPSSPEVESAIAGPSTSLTVDNVMSPSAPSDSRTNDNDSPEERMTHDEDDRVSSESPVRRSVVNSPNSCTVTIRNNKPSQSPVDDADDVINISDMLVDDSVIFVSETQHETRALPTVRQFGNNYIRLEQPQEKPVSVRARRNAEKRKQKAALGVQ